MTRADLDWGEQLATPEDIAAWRTPVSDEDREAVLENVRWFTRRYPTVAERLDWARRKWREAQLLREAGALAASRR